MLCTLSDSQMALGTTINVTQMAALVEDMMQRPADKEWFHDRITTAHLSEHETSALIAMYERLQEKNLLSSLSSDENVTWHP